MNKPYREEVQIAIDQVKARLAALEAETQDTISQLLIRRAIIKNTETKLNDLNSQCMELIDHLGELCRSSTSRY